MGCGEAGSSSHVLPRRGIVRLSWNQRKQPVLLGNQALEAPNNSDPAQGFILGPPENATTSATRAAASETGAAKARNSKTTWFDTNPHY